MSRVTTFAAIGVVIIVAVYSRELTMTLLGPGSMMWNLVADVQFGSINGEEWARDMFQAVFVWVPWLLVGAAILGGAYREFTRTNVTQRRVR